MKLLENVYMVGAHAAGIVNASRTVRNLPRFPRGERIASTRPPMLFPSSKPSFQAGTYGADAASAAPRQWEVS